MAENRKVTLAITGTSSLWRARIRELFDQKQHHLNSVVVWEAATFDRAIQNLDLLTPDVLIVHSLGYQSELVTFLRIISRQFGNVCKILFGPLPPSDWPWRMLNVELNGYVNSEKSDDTLAEAICAALANACWFDKGFLAVTSRSTPVWDNQDTRIAIQLTDRQREILYRLASGQPNAQIAASLHISQRTVRHHLRRACDKIGVDNPILATIEMNIRKPTNL